jgi:flagellar basal-body rod modification protein FlgD
MSVTTPVSGVLAGVSRQGASNGSDAVALDPGMFLKLLVAEIKNQDPTKPMDSAALVQQLASFSQVQLSAETNSRLTNMLETLSIGQSAAVVGRGLIAEDGTDLGTVEAVRYTSQGLMALLVDGREVVLSQGVTIRA